MSPKKVDLKEDEYLEVYAIFTELTIAKNIPPIELFKKNLDVFFDLTYDAYVGSMGSNKEAMLNWIEFMGSEKLAVEYFRAVDDWHAYT